jgi:adenosine deaminase
MSTIAQHTFQTHLIKKELTQIISETNGIPIYDTILLLLNSDLKNRNPSLFLLFEEFHHLLDQFQTNQIRIHTLLKHPVSLGLSEFFKHFPLKYHEEHIHLTGALTAEFIFPRLMKLLNSPDRSMYEQKIIEVYGPQALPIQSIEDVDRLIRLKENEGFGTYLKILYLSKLILVSKEAHAEAAYHLASELYSKYNVGFVRLKFSLSRSTSSSSEQIPGSEEVSSEDVVMGLFEGFQKFKREHAEFRFVLSPSFRKESQFFDQDKFKNRKAHFMSQINQITSLLDRHPVLINFLTDVDTVGDEKEMYRKEHFNELKTGFRKLQYRGFKIRSHHGETWHTLKKGIQAVDNAMNIWHVDTLEHGISLGINPNFYFHRIYQETIKKNLQSVAITPKDEVYQEIKELDWGSSISVLDKLLAGAALTFEEQTLFLKAKFHTAREVEQYQHDVLNRLIQKEVNLVSLPSSNNKLTGQFQDHKDHPFSWWEKKNVLLGVGTDNYVTLNTNFIQEMLIILYTDCKNLKITKLLMVVTGENRRPYISHLLWTMRKKEVV